MKQLKRRLLYGGAGYLVSLMYSYGIAVSLIITHLLNISAFDAFEATALLLFILTLLFYNKWTSLATFLGAGGFAFWAFRYAEASDWILDHVPPFLKEVVPFVTGQAALSDEYHLPLALVFITVTLLFSRISASRLRGCPSMLIVAAAVFLTEWSLGHENILMPMALSAAAITVVFAYSFARHLFLRDMSNAEEDYTEEDELFTEGETVRTEQRTVRIPNATAIAVYTVPIALIASLMAFSVLPGSTGGFRSLAIESAVDDVVDYFGQYTGFTRKQYSFSISTMGYPSTGELGGPVSPSGDTAMVVEGISPSLLKGSVKRYYSGKGWYNSGDLGSYRYDSALWSSRRTEVFDLERPDPALTEETAGVLYRNIRLRITPYRNLYTIFSPTRPYEIYGDSREFVPYFNDLSELYPKRKMGFRSAYTVQARQFANITTKVRNYIVELEQTLPPEDAEKMAELHKQFLQLPEELPDSVRELGVRLANSTENDSTFLRAMAIKQYLVNNFTYTLNPSPIPEDRDFVEFFLETKEGYCTYYATAMTVLARSAGIPARYVEGFLLTNLDHEDFVYTVTGNQAHAWAELYFEGIGWIPFDATPIGQPRTAQPTAPSEPSAPEIPTPTPSVEIPVEIPEAAPKEGAPTWLILVLTAAGFVLVNVALVIGHRFRYGKKRLLRKYGSKGAIEIWWRSILDMLPNQDKMFRRRDGETSVMLSARIGNLIECKVCTFDQLVRIIMRSYYSTREPSETEIDVVYRYFLSLENRMLATSTPPGFAVKRILFPRAFGFRGIKKK